MANGNRYSQPRLHCRRSRRVAVCTFALACGLWWVAYRLRCSANGIGKTAGFLIIGLWLLNLVGGAVLASHQVLSDLFSSAFAALCLLLIISISTTLSEVRYGNRRRCGELGPCRIEKYPCAPLNPLFSVQLFAETPENVFPLINIKKLSPCKICPLKLSAIVCPMSASVERTPRFTPHAFDGEYARIGTYSRE